MSNKPHDNLFCRSPQDPREHDRWATNKSMRMILATYVKAKATCDYCKHTYFSVDDFIDRSPILGGFDENNNFIYVCGGCWHDFQRGREAEK